MSDQLLRNLESSIAALSAKATTVDSKIQQDNKLIKDIQQATISILKSDFESQAKTELWVSLNSNFSQRPSLEFIRMRCSFMQQDEQRLQLFVLLEISAKSLSNMWMHLANTPIVAKLSEKGVIRTSYKALLQLSEKLKHITFIVEGRLPLFFTNFLAETHKKDATFTPQLNTQFSSLILDYSTSTGAKSHRSSTHSKHEEPKKQAHSATTITKEQPTNSNQFLMAPSASQSSSLPSAYIVNVNGNSSQTKTPKKLSEIDPSSSHEHRVLTQIHNLTHIYKNEVESNQPNKHHTNTNDIFANNQGTIDDMEKMKSFISSNLNRKSNTNIFNHFQPRGTLANSESHPHLLAGIQDQSATTPGQTQKRVRPSIRLYETRFTNTQQDSFRSRNPTPATVESQNGMCKECKAKISKGILYIIGNNANYCEYTGFWYCNDCISQDKKLIWWHALENFDLTGYQVCKTAAKEIDYLATRPILQFEYDCDLVNKNSSLYEFMILKRSIYLLYDVLCDPSYLEHQLSGYLNLCLKQNLFSLKNFYEINNGSLTTLLENTFKLFMQHIEGCDKCSKRAKECTICNESPKLYVFDLRNTSLCDRCSEMYHRNCLQAVDCQKCKHDG